MDIEKYIQSLPPYKRKKYGVTKECPHCKEEFVTKPKRVNYCSQACSNPQNRGEGVPPWNKGQKMPASWLAKNDTTGLAKGRGWLAKPEYKEKAERVKKMHSERMKGSGNPNWEGKTNNLRPKAPRDCEWDKYKREVKKATYRSVYQMKKEGLVPEGVGRHKGMLQLDHIVSKKQGYTLKIDPLLIGHRNNLQFISQHENRYKWDRFQPEEVVNELLKGSTRSLRES